MRLKNWGLYVIIDSSVIKDRDPLEIARSVIRGGCSVIQLRDKTSSTKSFLDLARAVKTLVRKKKIPVIINDRVDVAMAADADGVHLGQDDLPLRAARNLLGSNKIIGISTHNPKEALQAQSEGADYISVGPVYRTPMKALSPRGVEFVRDAAKVISIPFAAIGGINGSNVDEVLSAGARTIAVIRSAIAQKDVFRATKTLREKIQKYKSVAEGK